MFYIDTDWIMITPKIEWLYCNQGFRVMRHMMTYDVI